MQAPEWPSAVERQQIDRALHGKDVEKLTIVVSGGSPWLQVDAWVHMEGDYKLALWRSTGAVYELDSLGAVKDDPIIPAGWNMETL
jgi:hypothetical protein